MSIETWLLFCATESVLCFTPGPAVLLVVSMGLARGASAGLRASFGILAANAFYFLLSASGVGAMLLASWKLFFLIKWLGAAYLIWLGVRMLLARSSLLRQTEEREPVTRRAMAPFTHGLVTQGANPKALVFFTALLPQFINPAAALPLQVGILAVSSILIELVVLAIYVAACHRARRLVRRPAFAGSLNRVGGVLLIGAGAGLATMRRS